MNEKVTLTIEKLRELCPKCADKITKDSLAKGIRLRNVSIKKSDYAWLMMKEEGRPPKDWFDNCIDSVSQRDDVDDPSALCAYIWQNKGDEEAVVPNSEDAMGAVKAKMKMDECMTKLRKDIETVLCWRKFGKVLNQEQQRFADRVADEMISYRVAKQVGAQLVSGNNIRFIKKGMLAKGMQPTQESNAVAGITQDAVAVGPSKKGKFPRKTEEQVDLEKIAKPKGDTQPSLKESPEESGSLPRKTADIKNVKSDLPEGQRCGEVNAVIDSKTDPKQLSPDDKGEIAIEEIGHHPNLPMPRKMAQELIRNAQWGVEIGAYTNVREGMDRQLGRKAYAEFIDTDSKLSSVLEYLNNLIKE